MELRSRALLIINTDNPLYALGSRDDIAKKQANDTKQDMVDFIKYVEYSQGICETLSQLKKLGHLNYKLFDQTIVASREVKAMNYVFLFSQLFSIIPC